MKNYKQFENNDLSDREKKLVTKLNDYHNGNISSLNELKKELEKKIKIGEEIIKLRDSLNEKDPIRKKLNDIIKLF